MKWQYNNLRMYWLKIVLPSKCQIKPGSLCRSTQTQSARLLHVVLRSGVALRWRSSDANLASGNVLTGRKAWTYCPYLPTYLVEINFQLKFENRCRWCCYRHRLPSTGGQSWNSPQAELSWVANQIFLLGSIENMCGSKWLYTMVTIFICF